MAIWDRWILPHHSYYREESSDNPQRATHVLSWFISYLKKKTLSCQEQFQFYEILNVYYTFYSAQASWGAGPSQPMHGNCFMKQWEILWPDGLSFTNVVTWSCVSTLPFQSIAIKKKIVMLPKKERVKVSYLMNLENLNATESANFHYSWSLIHKLMCIRKTPK